MQKTADLDPPTCDGQASITAGGEVIAHSFEDGDDTSFPVWFDGDGDGDLDRVMGAGDGLLWLYEDDGGDPTSDLLAGRLLTLRDGELLHVGEDRPPEDFQGHSGDRAQPAPADFDADGDTDLVVGDAWGGLCYFENTGDDTFLEGVPGGEGPGSR